MKNILNIPALEKFNIVEKENEDKKEACCVPIEKEAACCNTSRVAEDNNGGCCEQPADGSACCNK